MHALLKKWVSTIFPNQCLLCDLPNEKLICDVCEKILPWCALNCKYCGLKLETNDVMICGQCITTPPHYHCTYALFEYAEPISNFISQLKFHSNLTIATLFSTYWIQLIEKKYSANDLPELIIPVPLHDERLKERGFNQALEIAKPIGKYFNIPVDIKTCIRIKNTEAQSSLPASKRKNNLKNAFGLSYSISAKHIAILDDVMTTGNTMNEIAQLFKKVSVERIDIWCCARTGN